MVLLPTDFIRSSEFLIALCDDCSLSDEYTEIDVQLPISNSELELLTNIFNTIQTDPSAPLQLQHIKDINQLPVLLKAASFLQINKITTPLIAFLNRFCQYDDSRLDEIKGSINPYWLGDLIHVKAATKVWLGLLTLPLTKNQMDSSCYSCAKFMGKLMVSLTINQQQNCYDSNTEDECMALFKSMNVDFSSLNTDYLAKYNFFVILKYCYDDWGCEPSLNVPIHFAKNGNLEGVQWAVEAICGDLDEIWNGTTYLGSKHDRMLQIILNVSAKHGHNHISEWLEESWKN